MRAESRAQAAEMQMAQAEGLQSRLSADPHADTASKPDTAAAIDKATSVEEEVTELHAQLATLRAQLEAQGQGQVQEADMEREREPEAVITT